MIHPSSLQRENCCAGILSLRAPSRSKSKDGSAPEKASNLVCRLSMSSTLGVLRIPLATFCKFQEKTDKLGFEKEGSGGQRNPPLALLSEPSKTGSEVRLIPYL